MGVCSPYSGATVLDSHEVPSAGLQTDELSKNRPHTKSACNGRQEKTGEQFFVSGRKAFLDSGGLAI